MTKPSETPDEVPTHERVQSILHLPGDQFDAHDDPIGLLLAMADRNLRAMVEDHGADAGSIRIRAERGTVENKVEEGEVENDPVVVLIVEADRPFGWVRPADHVGEPGSEVS